ncbi:hypothetical protein [Streptomyces longispororuber]|uniref:hypothetical protein n=1 Tax=Streptomyces longispororuber TaxID=68230 RepID=UPI0036F6BD0A
MQRAIIDASRAAWQICTAADMKCPNTTTSGLHQGALREGLTRPATWYMDRAFER